MSDVKIQEMIVSCFLQIARVFVLSLAVLAVWGQSDRRFSDRFNLSSRYIFGDGNQTDNFLALLPAFWAGGLTGGVCGR